MLESDALGALPAGGEAVCTLFEGDYHLGLAAFVNSLVRAGYAGTVWAGYRGSLPPWVDQLKRMDTQGAEYMVADQIRLVFLPIETKIHFTSYKPQFMLDLFADQARDSAYLWYFDPDILVRCGWSFFARWQRNGIALCHEIVSTILPDNSPQRYQWIEIALGMGLDNPRALNHYFNGGMVGVSAAHTDFLRLWKRLIEVGQTKGGDINQIATGTREMPFACLDQDSLNIAAMYTKHPLTTMGPEAMGFVPSGFTMYHAVGPKPWRASFVFRALAGTPPSGADKFFFTQVSSPIRVYSLWRLRAKRLACSVAALIGRFYRRG